MGLWWRWWSVVGIRISMWRRAGPVRGATRTWVARWTMLRARRSTRWQNCWGLDTREARGSTRWRAQGDPAAVEFRFQEIKRRDPASGDKQAGVGHPGLDFSFSGIKTAVLRYVETHGMKARVEARRAALLEVLRTRPGLRPSEGLKEIAGVWDAETLDLIASFQAAVVGNLLRQTFRAAEAFGARGIVVSGGVAANSELRHRFAQEGERRGLPVAFPAVAMTTDNAAMIAAAGWAKFCQGQLASEEMVASPQLKLG